MKTRTRGNVIVDDIKVGDIHYEFEYGFGIKVEVLTLPVLEGNVWTWTAKNINTGKVVDYLVNKQHPHYGPNLYDHEAYVVKRWV